jgi:RNA polymerase sigma-70 factor (ECF subfamily)
MIDTSESLLDRLKAVPADEAWKQFYEMYWGAILRYARKLGLDETQAQDVLQETMVILMRILPEFAYDRNKGKFRNFMLTIVHRRSLAVLRRARQERGSHVPWEDNGEGESADPFGNLGTDEVEAVARWQEALMEEALRRVREAEGLGENTFAVFDAYAIQRRAPGEVAKEFGLKENAVYQIKNRLLRRLQVEVAKLRKNSGMP